MKDLKHIDIKVIGDFIYSETISISVDGVSAEYTPDAVLGVVSKLAELQKTLVDALVVNRMKEIDAKE